jgi:nitroreductase
MDINEAISGRRSVRNYTEKAVDEATIRSLISAAVLAPNAVNQQPWTFTVVRDQGVLDRISHEAKTSMLATLPDGPDSDYLRSMLIDPNFNIFYHAPALVLVSAAPGAMAMVEDCAMAAQNLMLTAHAAGLGTCWIGFAQGYVNTPEGKALLGLPAEWLSVAPIIVGYPKAATPPVSRMEPEIRWVG